jgi:CheY-like chemotaxis protein
MPRILVVEDNEEERSVLVLALRDAGWTVEEAAGGRIALDLVATMGHFDLLVLDVGMPDLSGVEFLEAAREGKVQRNVSMTLRHRGNTI